MSSTNLLSAKNRSLSTASIRKRILRSNSDHQSQKQLIKSSTMISFRPKLQRFINEGKIDQLINTDRHSKGNLQYTSHLNDMQKQLSVSKKNYSSMVLKTKSKEFNINKLKDQIARYIKEKQIIIESNQKINKIYKQSSSALQSKNQSKQVAEWTQKSYIYLKQRLAKDQYFYKIQYQRYKKRLQQQHARKQFLQRRSHQIIHKVRSLQNAMQMAQMLTSEHALHKNQHIDLAARQRQEQQFLYELRVEKQRKQATISELASWVIQKQQLAKYLNILYTHRLLGGIIRTKNNNLLKKYAQVQGAYMHIKSNTNIIQFDKILKKMQQQDGIYDITVRRVSELQERLEKAEKKLEMARKEREGILAQEGKNQQLEKGYYQGIERDRYQLLISNKQKLQFRIIQDQILKERIIEWGYRFNQRVLGQKQTKGNFEGNLQRCVQILVGKE